MLTYLSLFSGIGGIDLGLDRAGMRCVAQVECDPFALRVLAKHWPQVPRFTDVRTFTGKEVNEPIDLIAFGFPCQDLSYAGDGAGLDGDRSGLFFDAMRIVRAVRPAFVLVENVAALLVRGLGRVLGELARSGFDAEWSIVPACALGATHMRRRLFIVAYANSLNGWSRVWDTDARSGWPLQAVDSFPSARTRALVRLENPSALYRGADGVADRMDRNRGIGNAVYPDVAEWIGRRIIAADARLRGAA